MSITLKSKLDVSGTLKSLDILFFSMDLKSGNATKANVERKPGDEVLDSAVFRGANFTYSTETGDRLLAGGTLQSIDQFSHFMGNKTKDLEYSNLSLDVASVLTAIQSEVSGNDRTAIETLLFDQDWTYFASDFDDILTRSTKTSDGTKINMAGNDRVNLGKGNDNFFVGDGSDKLNGNAGQDRLLGGKGNDILKGGAGKDALFGEAGNDVLNGGTGKDKLVGGSGADVFAFKGKFGKDRVLDFEDGTDKFDIAFDDLTISQKGKNVVMTHNKGTIVLVNADETSISSDDFLL